MSRGTGSRSPIHRPLKFDRDPASIPHRFGQRLLVLVEGFSLEAGRHVHQHDRAGLERLCRYGCRPPLAVQRLSRGSDDQLILRFKKPLADGSTEVRLNPTELMRRLATIVPPPGFHLVGYHGLFASRSKLRSKVVPGARKVQEANTTIPNEPPAWAFPPSVASVEDLDLSPFPALSPRERYLCWAELLKRTRLVDVPRCEKCDGRMELVAFVTDPNLAAGVLEQLGMSIPARTTAAPARVANEAAAIPD